MSFISRRIRKEFLTRCEALPVGKLWLQTPEGHVHQFGNSGPEAEWILRDWRAAAAIAARGDTGLGESYVEGLWDSPSIEALATLALRNLSHFRDLSRPILFNRMKNRLADRLLHANSRSGAAKNIKKHYDVGNEFFQLWLDPGMTYSSGLYGKPTDSLEQAQRHKHDRILDRMVPGESVLEIGCGWGSFAERAADLGRDVTAITISPSQKAYADARLDGRARIELCDYRDQQGTFDNIVSIEMVEAVGERYWPLFFNALKSRLAEGGRIVLQAITVQDNAFDDYRRRSDFIRRHTFPGGMLLSESVISREAGHAGLAVKGTFAFGKDYWRTCRTWAAQVRSVKRGIAELGHGPEFLRSWQYYLEICAASFAVGRTSVVQVELAHAEE